MDELKLITEAVVAAVIRNEADKVFIQQRPEGKSYAGKWELPGGKVKENESLEDALQREIEEELDIYLQAGKWLAACVKVRPAHRNDLIWIPDTNYILNFYDTLYDITDDEFEDYFKALKQKWAWVGKADLKNYDLIHEDLKFLLSNLVDLPE